MRELAHHPLFGLTLCVASYAVGQRLHRLLGTPFANPLLIAMALSAAVLRVLGVEYADFNRGAAPLVLFLSPATASLAVAVHRRRDVLRRAFLPVLAGCAAGSAVSMLSVHALSRLAGLDDAVAVSLLPKSVTTPIAVGLAEGAGGLPAVTAAVVIATGITGAVLAPVLMRAFHLNDPVAVGVGIGVSSHAIGTARAMELGEIQGAMSGISIGIAGLVTTVYFLFV